MSRGWKRGSTFALRLLAVPLGLAALYIVVDALLAFWDKLPAPERRRARTSWRWRSRWLRRSRPLSFWPVVLVLLTSVLGIADWLPATGWSRPMGLGLIAAVGINGYFREQADQKKSPSWLSPMWRDVDSLKKQNESIEKEIETLRPKNSYLSRSNKLREGRMKRLSSKDSSAMSKAF
jgi:hypothetical protein